MRRDNCILCGKQASDSENWAYFERGFSEKYFLCDTCYSHKVNLLDFNIDEEKYIISKAYMETHLEGKVAEIRKIVTAWIDGENFNYFPETTDCIYYVEGPEAYLFVFKDRVVVLSSKVLLSYTMNAPYSIILNKSIERKKRRDCTNDVRVVFYNDKRRSEVATYEHWSLSEIKKSNYQNATECIRTDYKLDEENPIDLNVSLGKFGELIFNYSGYFLKGHEDMFYGEQTLIFRFFYHQNQLMEEIYNYIQKRFKLVRKEECKGGVKQKAIATGARRIQLKEGVEDNSRVSTSDEIKKMKELFDCGIISQEEFDEAKKRLISKL